MRRHLLFILLLLLAAAFPARAADSLPASPVPSLQEMASREQSAEVHEIGETLAFRARTVPFLPVATGIFLAAILHTFLAAPVMKLAHKEEERHRTLDLPGVSFKATALHFAGEVEAIFGIWAAVLLTVMAAWFGLDAMKGYIGHVNFTEPLFVAVIMVLSSTRPVLNFAESCLGLFARLGKSSPGAWWLAILIVGPLLGSFITEPGAMTICAMLLGRRFYPLQPSPRFAYATLGLLFVNVSVGGVMTHFAAPPVLMVAQKWGLTTPEMMLHYGVKAVAAILISTFGYYAFFRSELAAMAQRKNKATSPQQNPSPRWITLVHLGFMAWTVAFAHTPALFIGGFLFFLAFSQATAHHQRELQLRGPLLVGFFLAGLVVHGGLQGWWLEPILSSLGKWPLFLGSTLLTSFNDNAAITFLASQVDGLGPMLKYAVLAGAVAGGGLTVIANAPNPAGQTLLAKHFPGGVAPLKLMLGALIPTVVAAAALMLFPDWGVEKMFAMDDPSAPPSAEHHP